MTWIGNEIGHLGPAFVIALGGMAVVWVLSLVYRDSSLVDRFWGLGFVLISGWVYFTSEGVESRATLVLGLVAVWGLRLAIYIHLRNRGRGEDARYAAMRARRPDRYWWWSAIWVFGLQGVLMALISAPLVWVVGSQGRVFSGWDALGLALWGTGMFFETVADAQMWEFKKDPDNRGKVLSHGLWGRTRHPNYFGECLIWWGYFILALNQPTGWFTLFSPVLMTVFLLKVTGVTVLEEDLVKKKPAYAEYVRQVPTFFPRLRSPSKNDPG